jgi:hypothetical protein
MRETVWLAANTLTYPEGGGHLWAYLNWALGLRQAGCNVVWLEHVDPALPEAEMERLTVLLKQKLARYGLGDAMALCARDGSELPRNATANLIPLDAAGEADLFLNMAYNNLSSSVLARFRRTLLLDIDPGLLQVWISEGAVSVPRHDLYFTIGETVGKADSLFPSGEYDWIYTAPCVALENWPVLPVPADAPFTTITHWGAQEWLTYGEQSFANDKRAGFLPYLELPRHTSVPIELALCQAADEQLRLLPYEEEERQREGQGERELTGEVARQVAAHDLRLVFDGKMLERSHIVRRLGQPLGMRVIGAVEHAVNADEIDQVVDALLVERADVDAVLDLLHRVTGEGLGCLFPHLGHVVQ